MQISTKKHKFLEAQKAPKHIKHVNKYNKHKTCR